MDIFAQASRAKLRFTTSKGVVSHENLWDFTLTELNSLAVKLDEACTASKGKSFLDETSKEDATTKLMFDVVLFVLETKKKELAESRKATEIKLHNNRIDELIAKQKEAALEKLSVAELEALRK